MMWDRWNQFNWWYTIMPLVMIPVWVAFVGVVIAKIHTDHNAPSPARLDIERILAESYTRNDVGTDDHRNVSTISAGPRQRGPVEQHDGG